MAMRKGPAHFHWSNCLGKAVFGGGVGKGDLPLSC